MHPFPEERKFPDLDRSSTRAACITNYFTILAAEEGFAQVGLAVNGRVNRITEEGCLMKFVLVLLLLLVPFSLCAETVDLAGAVKAALENRPFAVAAREEARAAEAGIVEARSRLLPHLHLSENFVASDEPGTSLFISLNQEDLRLSPTPDPYNFPPSRQDFETRATLQQTLFDPDAWYGLRRADAGAEAADAAARWAGEEAAFAAFRAYLDVQQARAARGWAEAGRGEAEEILRLAEERHKSGVGLEADVLQARVALAESERRLVSVANDLLLARKGLALAMGRPGEEMEISAPLAPEQLSDVSEEDSLRRADLEALAGQIKEARLAHRQGRADWLPRASLSASYALHDGGSPFGDEAGAWTVRAGLNWELFDGLRRSGTGARTAALSRAAQNRRTEAVRGALLALEEAKLRAEEARLHLVSARRSVIEAEEALRLTRQRFEAGLSPLVELLTAQRALDQARFAALTAESRQVLTLGNIRFQQGTFVSDLLSAWFRE
jgi:outer membrane protein